MANIKNESRPIHPSRIHLRAAAARHARHTHEKENKDQPKPISCLRGFRINRITSTKPPIIYPEKQNAYVAKCL